MIVGLPTGNLRNESSHKNLHLWSCKALYNILPCMQIQDAKDVVYGMPDGDIPQIFRSAGDESQEDPEIEFLEESGPYKKKTKVVYNLC